MSARILTERDVRALLPMPDCIDAMEDALKTLARGDGVNPLRSLLRYPDAKGVLGLMPAWLGASECTGIKVVTVTPGNHGSAYDAHQGVVLLFETEHGRLRGVLDASSITAIRTAAVSGAATRALARKDAARLAILGSGVQASSHLAAMLAVRPLREITVWSRTRANAEAFARREGERLGREIRVAEDARGAAEGADILCTVTSSPDPVLRGEWIAPGAHVNAAGACFPAHRELDGAAVARARMFVDRRESAVNESGDFRLARDEGAVGDDHIVAELGDVFLGRHRGRETETEITLFESLGIAVEDLATAELLVRRAEETDTGAVVDFGGRREGA